MRCSGHPGHIRPPPPRVFSLPVRPRDRVLDAAELGTIVGFILAATVGIFGFKLPVVTSWADPPLVTERVASALLVGVLAPPAPAPAPDHAHAHAQVAVAGLVAST
jgi:hypothetical protein